MNAPAITARTNIPQAMSNATIGHLGCRPKIEGRLGEMARGKVERSEAFHGPARRQIAAALRTAPARPDGWRHSRLERRGPTAAA